jgi:uncharacterized membrane protein YqgA involved in biofilm formation
MIGTLINVATILIGSILGMVFGSRLPERIQKTIIAGLGLFTGAIGIHMFLKHENPIIVLGALLLGGVIGEWWKLEARLRRVGEFLEDKYSGLNRYHSDLVETADRNEHLRPDKNRFLRGFLTASLLFCTGPMSILGSIQDGLIGDYQLLTIKAVLDGFASLAFASSLGVGVLFSFFSVLIYQGGISLVAAQAQALLTPSMMNEMTAVGGLLLLGLAISSLLEIKKIRTGNFLPALAFAPLIDAILSFIGSR